MLVHGGGGSGGSGGSGVAGGGSVSSDGARRRHKLKTILARNVSRITRLQERATAAQEQLRAAEDLRHRCECDCTIVRLCVCMSVGPGWVALGALMPLRLCLCTESALLSHSISFRRAEGIPKYKMGFGRERMAVH